MYSYGTGRQLQYVNWHFGNVAVMPEPADWATASVRLFVPEDDDPDAEEAAPDPNAVIDTINEESKVEVWLELVRPFRYHDVIEITNYYHDFSGSLTCRTENMLMTTIYYEETLSADWENNRFVNLEGTTSDDGNGVMGYVVPCDVVDDYTIRVYGIYAEVDPRSTLPDDKTLVIGILGVKNPDLALSNSVNTWDVVHKRWSYIGGPCLSVHETLGISIEDTIQPEDIKATCSLTNEDTYSSYISTSTP